MKMENGEKQMNKELEALKEARNFRHEKDKNLVLIDIDYFNQCLDGIEKELEDLEAEKIALMESNDLLNEALYDDLKKVKALEIIKEKNIDVRYFIDDFVKQDYGWDLYDDYSEQYHYGKDDFSRYDGEYLTQEQFELLKEVLV